MQRKPTKNTRGPDADEKQFMQFTKLSNCIVCGCSGPSIVDHALGACAKHNKQLIGHRFVIPLCPVCDSFKSTPNGSKVRFVNEFGRKLWEWWVDHNANFEEAHPDQKTPDEIKNAIIDRGQ